MVLVRVYCSSLSYLSIVFLDLLTLFYSFIDSFDKDNDIFAFSIKFKGLLKNRDALRPVLTSKELFFLLLKLWLLVFYKSFCKKADLARYL